MNEDFWVNITKSGLFYVVEKWQAGENRILYVEKKKTLTKFGAKRYARRYIINLIANNYLKEKQ